MGCGKLIGAGDKKIRDAEIDSVKCDLKYALDESTDKPDIAIAAVQGLLKDLERDYESNHSCG